MMVDLKELNKTISDNQLWTLGIVEAMGMLEIVIKQKFDTKNRVALILLDSNFEIALKEFIVNRKDLYPQHIYNDAKIATIFKAPFSYQRSDSSCESVRDLARKGGALLRTEKPADPRARH